MNIYLDIETIPSQDPACHADILAEIETAKAEARAPSNYKDPAKIREYVSTRIAELDAQAEDRWRSTALDGTRGEIICVSWAIDDLPTCCTLRGPDGAESTLLSGFFAALGVAIKESHGRLPRFIGHNIKDFDLRFIFQRAVIRGVRPPCNLPHDARGNNEHMYDTMLAWAGWGNHISLDRLCRALGMPGKTDGMDGSKVWDAVQAGEIQKVADYCRQDVECVRAVYRRLNFVGVAE